MQYFQLKKSVLVIGLIVFSQLAFSQDKDTLFIKGQAPIVGKLINVKQGNVGFDGENIGKLNVELEDVKTISASKHTYRIKTLTREFYLAGFKAHGEDGKIYLDLGQDEEDLDFGIEELYKVKLIYKNFLDRLSGDLGLGYSYTKNSGVGRWNGDLELIREGEKSDISLSGDIILTQNEFITEENLLQSERENLQLNMDYFLRASTYSFAKVKMQRNLELGITRRLQKGVGIGKQVIHSNNSRVRLQTGIFLNQEFTTEGMRRNNLFELPLEIKVDFLKIKNPDITIEFEQTFFVGLTQTGRFRNDGDTKVKWDFLGDFHLKISIYNNVDTVHPLDGNLQFDYGVVFGFGYSL